MSWRWHRRVKILPGVWLNFSKHGISVSAGTRGLRVNVGKRGTYLTSSIPGTGLSYRQRLDLPQPRASTDPPYTMPTPAELDKLSKYTYPTYPTPSRDELAGMAKALNKPMAYMEQLHGIRPTGSERIEPEPWTSKLKRWLWW
jgi:Protein of unknown function (DUF4236)